MPHGDASFQISMDIRPILTLRGDAKYLNIQVRVPRRETQKVEKYWSTEKGLRHFVSISSTFFARIFRTNVILAAFSTYV